MALSDVLLHCTADDAIGPTADIGRRCALGGSVAFDALADFDRRMDLVGTKCMSYMLWKACLGSNEIMK